MATWAGAGDGRPGTGAGGKRASSPPRVAPGFHSACSRHSAKRRRWVSQPRVAALRAGGLFHVRQEARAGQEQIEFGRDVPGGTDRHEEPVLAVGDHVRPGGVGGRDDRQAARHRFEDHQSEPLEKRRERPARPGAPSRLGRRRAAGSRNPAVRACTAASSAGAVGGGRFVSKEGQLDSLPPRGRRMASSR